MNRTLPDHSAKRPPNPNETANPLSKLFYWWVRDLFVMGVRKQITRDTIYATKKCLHSKSITALMQERWQREQQRPNPSLMRLLIGNYGWPVIFWGAVFMLMETVSR